MRLRYLIAVMTGVLVLLVAAACGGSSTDKEGSDVHAIQPGTASSEGGYRGGTVTPPFEKPDVVLTDTNGEPFDLRKETDGEITLLFLGYTNCPDICPTHMVDMASTLSKMPAEQAEKVKVVFVTTDPERDTPEVIGEWLSHFNPNFIGLTGDMEAIGEVHQALSMPLPTTTDLGDGDYAVSHAAFVFAFGRDNQADLVIPSGFSQENWLHDLQKLVTEG